MEGTENTSSRSGDQQHAFERVQFLRMLIEDWTYGMPMPFQIYFDQSGGSAQLRYRPAEEVDACVARIGGKAVHDSHCYEPDKYHDEGWHGYGTSYAGGRYAEIAGLTIQVWAAVDGPAPKVES